MRARAVPKFDDLDESGLDAWELPDVQFDTALQRDRTSSMSTGSDERGSFAAAGVSARSSSSSSVGGGGAAPAAAGASARARNSSVTPAVAGAKSPPTPRKLPPDVVCIAKALYAYKANNDDEHSFAAGDVFEVVSKDSENC